MGCRRSGGAFLSLLVLVACLADAEAARRTHREQGGEGGESLAPRFTQHVKDIASSDSLYHDLSHSHYEHIPQGEGSTRWFTRNYSILGGRPVATVEYVLDAVKRFERRHADKLGKKAPESTRRRHLLAPALAPGANPNSTALQGELDVDSLYWATLKLGTPATQTATVQVDSGSDLLWIQCSECGSSCRPTKVAPYRSASSSTASYATCAQCPALNASLCPVGQCNIHCQRSGLASPAQVCQSVYGYGDNSQVLFNVQSDVITFSQLAGTAVASAITFGCDIAETVGLITNSKVNGLMGLGRSNLSVPSQLYAAGKINQDSFSVCLGGFEGGGALLFGNDTTPPTGMAYTPMGKGSGGDTLYNSTFTAVKVGNATLNLTAAAFYNASNDRPDAIIDTGSDLIALPSLLYNAIFAALNKSITLPAVSFDTVANAGAPQPPPAPPVATSPGTPPTFANSLGNPTCYQLNSAVVTNRTPYDASTNFPQLTFTFIGNASLVLHPDDYVQFIVLQDPKSTRSNPAYLVYGCPFIFNTFDGGFTLLGDYAMRNHYFTFDRTQQIIGFASVNCSTYQPRSSSAPIPFLG